jgi:pyrroline-5-carboxylate reductase
MTSKIAIIGTGNMGSAFFRGLSEHFSDDELAVCDTSEEKLQALGAKHASTDINQIVADADVVLMAVKPQSFEECISSITEPLAEKLIVSIMAGVTMKTIQEKTGSKKIVRSMPNLGVQVGRGMTGWIASAAVSDDEKALTKKIFVSLGAEIELKSEDLIDPLSTVSGSGPAYFFYLTEKLAKNAEALGFSKENAKTLAEETFVASAQLLDQNEMSAEEWRTAVSSKKGTTEQAIKHFEEEKMGETLMGGMQKALKRSKEIAEEMS